MKKLLINLVIITAVSVTAFRLTSSFFSDTETSTGNVLAAGAIDLLISNTSYYNGLPSDGTTWKDENLPGNLFFDFNDLKPSDWGEDTIGLRVQNDAWACMKINLTEDNDFSCTEPELLDDATCSEDNQNAFDGELGSLVNFVFWADDGDNVFELGEPLFKEGTAKTLFNGSTWTLADSTTNIWTGSPSAILAETPTHIGKYWCFGNLTKTPLTPGVNLVSPTVSGFTCDGSSLNNAAQSDRLLADVEFTAVQARNNPTYRCNPEITCVETYADQFISESSDQGTNKNSTPVLANRSNGAAILGAPQSLGTPYDNPAVAGSFYSLGFNVGNPTGGYAVVKFATPFYDKSGDDLQIFEVTGGTTYPDELINVEVSSDGSTWTNVATSVARDALIDINPVVSAQYVRITDVSNINLFEPTADGYDLDAVKAVCGTNPN